MNGPQNTKAFNNRKKLCVIMEDIKFPKFKLLNEYKRFVGLPVILLKIFF